MSIRVTTHRFRHPHTVVLRHRQDAVVEILKMRKQTLVSFDLDFTPDEPTIRTAHWDEDSIIDVEGKEMYRFVGVVNIQRKSGYMLVHGSRI